MKNSVLARPNLKVLLLAAMLIVVVQALIGRDDQDGASSNVLGRVAAVSWTSDIDELTREAAVHPSYSVFLRISHYYEKQRDYKRAIFYLRRAERFARFEEEHQ